jgi:hypothetical protein
LLPFGEKSAKQYNFNKIKRLLVKHCRNTAAAKGWRPADEEPVSAVHNRFPRRPRPALLLAPDDLLSRSFALPGAGYDAGHGGSMLTTTG